jgi:hypothetical protein
MKLLFLILLILLIIFSFVFINNYKEHFTESESESESECNNFFDKNSFCSYDVDNNKCDCNLQKDDVKYIFNSPETCCKRRCAELPPEKCVDKQNFRNIPYYCNIGGVCKKYDGTVISSHISANNCGTDPLNNQIMLPYATLEECNKTIDPCDKYNIPTNSIHLNENNCIQDVNCGFCTGDTGGGKCISGTAEGPNDLQQYFFCSTEARTSANKYTYGDHAAYLLQPANINSFSNQNLVNNS